MERISEYENILEKLMNGELGQLLPEGADRSYPIYGRINSTIVDIFFLHGYENAFTTCGIPYAIIAFDKDSNQVITDSIIEKDSVQYLSNFVPFEMPNYDEYYSSYANSYMKIRSFVFSATLNEEQKSQLKEYMSFYKIISNNGYHDMYECIAFDFEAWASNLLCNE